jgi:hypothetical protein
MREPPAQGPLQGGEASLEDIRRAFASLTAADWVKLDAYASACVRRLGISASGRDAVHLFMQAMESLETGRRLWRPGNVKLVPFLIGTMWSISSNWARQRKATGYVHISETDLAIRSDEGEELGTALDLAQAKDPSPEQRLVQSEYIAEEQLIEEIESLFKDQPLVSLVVDGWKAGMKGPEIIEALNINDNEYRTAARLVRRRITARWPKGRPDVR